MLTVHPRAPNARCAPPLSCQWNALTFEQSLARPVVLLTHAPLNPPPNMHVVTPQLPVERAHI